MNYRTGLIYQMLEKIITDAGIRIIYQEVPADSIDGEIWARADYDNNTIMMPESPDSFPNEETACLILGHEMGHILSRLDSTDNPVERRKNEAICDIIGTYLYKLAELTAGEELERQLWGKEG